MNMFVLSWTLSVLKKTAQTTAQPQANLQKIIDNHIIPQENVRTEAIEDSLQVTANSGAILNFYEDNGPKIKLENNEIINIITPNIQAVNGVIQIVDRVIE